MLKLIIAEDHGFTRTGLVYSLQAFQNISIVAEVENGQDAIEATLAHQPDVILMDIAMPRLDGIAATQQIKLLAPHVKVIMLTSRQLTDEVCASLAAGADAYCMKDISTEQLVQAIQAVAQGAVWLDPAIARIIGRALAQNTPVLGNAKTAEDDNSRVLLTQLTEREMEVLHSIAIGKSNKEIAADLKISIHTVKAHVRNLIQKLSVDDRTQAAVKALQEGLIKLTGGLPLFKS